MRLIALVLALGIAPLTACDDNGEEGGGSLTQCDLNFGGENTAKKAFGMGCDADSECAFSECLMPGTPGNITNSVFGFCTRGCDCENNNAAKLVDGTEELLDCLYPSGFKNFHHVVVECSTVADCQALDPRWNACELASSGNARKVCHAK